jgi:hypothetical protein
MLIAREGRLVPALREERELAAEHELRRVDLLDVQSKRAGVQINQPV